MNYNRKYGVLKTVFDGNENHINYHLTRKVIINETIKSTRDSDYHGLNIESTRSIFKRINNSLTGIQWLQK